MNNLYKIKEDRNSIKLMKYDFINEKYKTLYRDDNIKDYYNTNYHLLNNLGLLLGKSWDSGDIYNCLSCLGIQVGELSNLIGGVGAESSVELLIDGVNRRELLISC